MKKSRYTEEQTIGILKQEKAGVKTTDLCREHGISAATFVRRRREAGFQKVQRSEKGRPIGKRAVEKRTVPRTPMSPSNKSVRDEST